MDKSTLYKLSYGLYAIGVQKGACIVNTVFQITSSPEVIALSMNKYTATHGLIKEQGRFSVSILNEDISPEIIRTLGFSSSRDTDKFSALPWEEEQGLPVLKKGCAGYLLCEVINSSDLGTHTVFFAKVQDAALRAHHALGLKGYSRADFILQDDGTLYILEVNTTPGMTSTSLVPREAAVKGMSFADLVERLLELALER